ncbi:hypothetical protein WR25_10215 [Diploscapter pachys]|uniref:Uncharacterized protein n=1 Tax=Diploscapter pachys TaxID=2018661 RepID=A0A2A2K774_9BILA|nr:hypothetical protein WR25_10215 [Diploscapter pachys]
MQAMLIREMPERTTEDTGDRWNALTLRERRDTFPSPFKNIRKSLGSTVGRVVRRVLRKSKVHTLDHQYDSVAPYSQQAASSSTANEKLTTSETDSQIVLTSFKTVILKGTKRACVAVSDGKVKLDDKNAKPKAMTTTLQQCSMDVNNCPSATQNSCTVNRTTSAAATGQESATGDQSSSAAIPVRTTTSQSSNMSGVSQHNNSNDDMDDEGLLHGVLSLHFLLSLASHSLSPASAMSFFTASMCRVFGLPRVLGILCSLVAPSDHRVIFISATLIFCSYFSVIGHVCDP